MKTKCDCPANTWHNVAMVAPGHFVQWKDEKGEWKTSPIMAFGPDHHGGPRDAYVYPFIVDEDRKRLICIHWCAVDYKVT